ncbi:MAG: hypothetical protein WA435_13800 [Gallionellaceae bacterium]
MDITTGQHEDQAKQTYTIPEFIFFLIIAAMTGWMVIAEWVVWLAT